MQCPRCQAENYPGHAYCDHCRAELKTGATLVRDQVKQSESSPPPRSLRRFGWRTLRLMLSAFLLFSAIVVARAVNWSSLIRGIAKTKPGIEAEAQRTGKPSRPRNEPGPRKNSTEKVKPKNMAHLGNPLPVVKPE